VLPESINPYLALMLGGFGVAVLGHLSRQRWAVAIGIIMVFLAVLIFPLALSATQDTPEPPGPVPAQGR
jgi:hypothetical protein